MMNKETRKKKPTQVEEGKQKPSQLSLELSLDFFKDDHMIDSTSL
jgi:hypothetical protein